MENRSGIVVEAELTETTGTAERETTITLLKRTSSRTCSPAWSAGRAPAYRRPSARRSTRRARNAGQAASALDLQTWKLARPAGPVVVIGTVGEDTPPSAQSTRSAQCESDDQWSPRARPATRGRFNGADAARKGALVAGWPGVGGGRLRSWLAPQQPLEVSRRASQTARPGGTLALPAWPNRVPTEPPKPALARLARPPGEFKMPACTPLHHPFRGPGNAATRTHRPRNMAATLAPRWPLCRLWLEHPAGGVIV